MIGTQTPFRISFAGGGSDLPAYFQQGAGLVVSAAINKYIYITVNAKFDSQIRASYSVTEMVDRVDQLQHELIRESLRLVGIEGGVEIISISDIPSLGTGLGSSSAYTVGLLKALHAFKGLHVGAERLSREACDVEIARCGKPIGKQDQYIAAYGGLQALQFNQDDTVFVDPIICSPDTRRRLGERLLLLYTGITRSANGILTEETQNLTHRPETRRAIGDLARLAAELRDALCRDDLDPVGEILHQGWLKKKSTAANVSNARIDAWYETAREHGALGGKITGAGGGGFLLLYAMPERHAEILRALPALRPVAFELEPQGSKIIYVEG
jgi:D-glycero-alpha-D-manno-heptose-7-phosphate kinase